MARRKRKLAFLTNDSFVLIHVANRPNLTLRDIAHEVGITEKTTQSSLNALEEEGIINRRKEGRNNRYRVDFQKLLEFQERGPYSLAQLAENLMRVAHQLPPAPAASEEGQDEDDKAEGATDDSV